MTRRIDDIYRWAVRNEVFWFFSAERLKAAAEAVLEKIPENRRVRDPGIPEGFVSVNPTPNLWGVFLYLAFLSLENLVKGIWIREHPEVDPGEVFKSKHIGHHRLRDLCRDADIQLDPAEQDFVALGEPVDALGRFPVPRSADHDIALDDSVSLNELNAKFQRLYERLLGNLTEGIPGDP